MPASHASPAFAPPSWAVLRVSGADAETFLQGQLSGDVRATRAIWTSYNSPKGRMLAVLHLLRLADGFELRMPRTLVEPIAKRLRMFVLRSKVTMEVLPAGHAEAEAEATDRRALIEAGVPVVYMETQDRWVAQMANLDLLGGISFDKGCYTGQEVVARLHYLGNLKKRMFRVEGAGHPPAPGTTVRHASGDGQSVGEIVDAVAVGEGFVASAVLQLAVAESDALMLDGLEQRPVSRPQVYVYA